MLLASYAVLVLGMGVAIEVAGVLGVRHVDHELALTRAVPGWTLTTGDVIDQVPHCDRSCSYVAHVRFRDASGVLQLFVAPPSQTRVPFGQPVRVAYDPADPRRAHDLSLDTSGFRFARGVGVFAIVVGAGFLVGMFFLLRFLSRLKPRRPSPETW